MDQSNSFQRQARDRGLARRELLLGMGAAAFAASGFAAAQQQGGGQHHQHHGAHAGHGQPKHNPLVRSANHCVATGEACLAHCIEMFKQGDTSLAVCADLVQDLTVSCRALAALAASDNAHLAEFAAVTAKVCKDCEAECRKHEQHPECKACAEACVECMKECEKITA